MAIFALIGVGHITAAEYVQDDAVSYHGSSFIALRDVTGVTPVVGADWDLLAAGTDQLLQEGDILIHDGNTPVRLARGVDTQILQLINGRPAWRTQAGVWCAHIEPLKQNPAPGLALLQPLRTDPSRYVQDSVANWLNDAAKTRPDWTKDVCRDWLDGNGSKATAYICRRAQRNLRE